MIHRNKRINSNSRARAKHIKCVRVRYLATRSTNKPNASESEIVFGCRSTSDHSFMTSVPLKAAKASTKSKCSQKVSRRRHSVEVLQNAPIIERAFSRSSSEILEGLTAFERTLADICIGWIGDEFGWKQYIKDNANVLLKIAIKNLTR